MTRRARLCARASSCVSHTFFFVRHSGSSYRVSFCLGQKKTIPKEKKDAAFRDDSQPSRLDPSLYALPEEERTPEQPLLRGSSRTLQERMRRAPPAHAVPLRESVYRYARVLKSHNARARSLSLSLSLSLSRVSAPRFGNDVSRVCLKSHGDNESFELSLSLSLSLEHSQVSRDLQSESWSFGA